MKGKLKMKQNNPKSWWHYLKKYLNKYLAKRIVQIGLKLIGGLFIITMTICAFKMVQH